MRELRKILFILLNLRTQIKRTIRISCLSSFDCGNKAAALLKRAELGAEASAQSSKVLYYWADPLSTRRMRPLCIQMQREQSGLRTQNGRCFQSDTCFIIRTSLHSRSGLNYSPFVLLSRMLSAFSSIQGFNLRLGKSMFSMSARFDILITKLVYSKTL